MESCDHPTVFCSYCETCNELIFNLKDYVAAPKNPNLYIKKNLVEESNKKDELTMLSNKKLALIIDLDKTLIDTVLVPSRADAQKIIDTDIENKDMYILFDLSETYLVRIRPGVHEFLANMNGMYDMRVFTLAQRAYATHILKKIDPEDKYFHKRVICVDDIKGDGRRKDIRHFFPVSDRLALVLDDNPTVWTERSRVFPGLIQITPFDFFYRSENEDRISPIGRKDDAMFIMNEIFTQIHTIFFRENLEYILLAVISVKKGVLEGCHICSTNPWQENDLKMAENFGAVPYNEFVTYATHLIVFSMDSPILEQAKKYKGIEIVGLSWLIDSIRKYKKQDEAPYRIPGVTSPTDGEIERDAPPVEDEAESSVLSDIFQSDEDVVDIFGDGDDLSFLADVAEEEDVDSEKD